MLERREVEVSTSFLLDLFSVLQVDEKVTSADISYPSLILHQTVPINGGLGAATRRLIFFAKVSTDEWNAAFIERERIAKETKTRPE